jgi:hypothetical protein
MKKFMNMLIMVLICSNIGVAKASPAGVLIKSISKIKGAGGKILSPGEVGVIAGSRISHDYYKNCLEKNKNLASGPEKKLCINGGSIDNQSNVKIDNEVKGSTASQMLINDQNHNTPNTGGLDLKGASRTEDAKSKVFRDQKSSDDELIDFLKKGK